MQEHYRRSVRIPACDYAAPGAYFITIVTRSCACLFGRVMSNQMQLSAQGHIAEGCWRAVPDHFPQVELAAYVVMPNHVHGTIVIHDRAAISSPPAEYPCKGVGASRFVRMCNRGR